MSLIVLGTNHKYSLSGSGKGYIFLKRVYGTVLVF